MFIISVILKIRKEFLWKKQENIENEFVGQSRSMKAACPVSF
jgi:hypothetical protein